MLQKLEEFKRLLILLSVLVFPCTESFAQFVIFDDFKSDFEAQVKSIDEFIERFNVGAKDTCETTQSPILKLFDHKINPGKLTEAEFGDVIHDFLDSVKNVQLSLLSDKMIAMASCRLKIMDKEKDVMLYLQQEKYKKDRVRWAFTGADGITKAIGIDKDARYPINPIVHEQHFMEFENLFENNQPEMFGFRADNIELDELTLFLTLCHLDKVRHVETKKLTIVCYAVPGFVFSINEIVRQGNNSGWLITSLTRSN